MGGKALALPPIPQFPAGEVAFSSFVPLYVEEVMGALQGAPGQEGLVLLGRQAEDGVDHYALYPERPIPILFPSLGPEELGVVEALAPFGVASYPRPDTDLGNYILGLAAGAAYHLDSGEELEEEILEGTISPEVLKGLLEEAGYSEAFIEVALQVLTRKPQEGRLPEELRPLAERVRALSRLVLDEALWTEDAPQDWSPFPWALVLPQEDWVEGLLEVWEEARREVANVHGALPLAGAWAVESPEEARALGEGLKAGLLLVQWLKERASHPSPSSPISWHPSRRSELPLGAPIPRRLLEGLFRAEGGAVEALFD